MNKVIERTLRGCDRCGEIVKVKHIKKINGNYYCGECARQIRKAHRKETYENSEDKENIRRLTNELKNKTIYESRRKKREEKLLIKQSQPPKIKRSKKTRVDKNNLYLTLQEKQSLFKMLMNRGIDGDDAKERIKNLVINQKELREKMLNQKKSDKEIKIKQNILLEELWNY